MRSSYRTTSLGDSRWFGKDNGGVQRRSAVVDPGVLDDEVLCEDRCHRAFGARTA